MAKEPRAPAVMPGSPVTAYPTPLIEDSIEVENVDIAGNYTALPFGTKYSSIEHGAFAKDLPEHILCADEPADASGGTRKRTWGKVREGQERYNFAISYDGNDVEYPVYQRTYVEPREGYEPWELLTPDPLDPFAFMVAEQLSADPPDIPQLKNVFVKVARIFQTLPGPILYSIEYPYGGHPSYPRITTKQKCAHMEFPKTLGTTCPIPNYDTAILVAQSIQQTEYAAVDSVQRIYDVVPKVVWKGDVGEDGNPVPADDFGGQQKFGYNVGYMYGRKDFPFITWQFTIPLSNYQPSPDLSPCPIAGYEKLRLVTQETKGDDKQAVVMIVSRRYETLPGPIIHKVDYDNNNPLYPIVSTSQRVAVTEYTASGIAETYCAVPGYTNLALYEQHLAPTDYGSVKEDQRVYEMNPSDKVITLDYDSTVDAFVQTIKQKVPAGTLPVLDSYSLEYREKPVDKYRTVTVQSKLTALPPTRVEYKTVNNWAFPTLLTGISLVQAALVANRWEIVWFPNTLRPIQNVPAILRITTSYFVSNPPPPETIFVLPTRNLVYQGISFQFSISNVLCDKIDLAVKFTGDTKYGNLSEQLSFAATNPSATQYYSVIGQYKIVGCDISIWRARVYVKTVTEVVLI